MKKMIFVTVIIGVLEGCSPCPYQIETPKSVFRHDGNGADVELRYASAVREIRRYERGHKAGNTLLAAPHEFDQMKSAQGYLGEVKIYFAACRRARHFGDREELLAALQSGAASLGANLIVVTEIRNGLQHPKGLGCILDCRPYVETTDIGARGFAFRNLESCSRRTWGPACP